jgi:hypothetical protein
VIVVVGGNRRKAGKTTVVCEIISAIPEAHWTAIKLTPHAHEPADYGDTERYKEAGAVKALLGSELPECSGNLIIESNSIMDDLKPDLFVFVDAGGEWKASALTHLPKADFIVYGKASDELLARVRMMLNDNF